MKNLLNCTVVMIPTENPNAITLANYIDGSGLCLIHKNNLKLVNAEPQHLYFVSEREPEMGDWITDGKKVYRNIVEADGYINLYKIEATTDSSLNESIKAEDRKFLQAYKNLIPWIPSSFIKKYEENDGLIACVDIETFVECDANLKNAACISNCKCKVQIKTNEDSDTVIIHPEKTYTKSEVIELLKLYDSDTKPVIISDEKIINTNEGKSGKSLLSAALNCIKLKKFIAENL